MAYAADWASRLGCPLRLLVPPGLPLSRSPGEAESLTALVRDCVDRDFPVHCEVSPCNAGPLSLAEARLRPTDLLVIQARTPLVKELLQAASPASGILVCPETWVPPSRFLLLDDGSPDGDDSMIRMLELCRQLRIIPILLTWTQTESQARQRQQRIRSMLGDSSAFAVSDSVVGGDVRSAVAGVARWRKCQTVVVRHNPTVRWLRWLQRSPLEELLDLADSLAVLALPGGKASELSRRAGKSSTPDRFSLPSDPLESRLASHGTTQTEP